EAWYSFFVLRRQESVSSSAPADCLINCERAVPTRLSARRRKVAYITLSSFRVNPEFQDFSLQPTGCLCEVIHIRRVDGGAL
ncbi:hypothetical protein KZC30_05910, partial [Salmonella enterica subsp. enterica serovar Javiana]